MKPGRVAVGHPVDVAFGTMYTNCVDIFIPGKVALTWERNYDTGLLGSPPTPMGPGWTTRYFATLTAAGREYRFRTPEGNIEVFADPEGKVENGGVIRNPATFREIARIDRRYIVTKWNIEGNRIERFVFHQDRSGGPWMPSSIEDATGQGLDLQWDSSRRLVQIRQRLEKRTLQIEYTMDAHVKSLSLALSHGRRQTLCAYEYDREGRLAAAYDAKRNADRYEYDHDSRIVKETMKDGGVFSFTYDKEGRCIRTSGLNRYDEKVFRYLDGTRWTEVTNSVGKTTLYHYLPSGQVVSVIDPLGAETRTEYDEYGRIAAVVNPNGGVTKIEFDDQGNRAKVTGPGGGSHLFTFNQAHLPLTITDPAGNVWKKEYDAFNRPVTIQDPAGSVWVFEYDARGNAVGQRTPTGARKRALFTDNGLLVEATDFLGNATRFAYDELGRVTQRIGPMGDTTEVAYDLADNPVEARFPGGASIRAEYDAGDNLASITDENGNVTRYRYGTCQRLVERIDRNGNSVRYAWGTEPNQLQRIINEKAEVYEFAYDDAGRVLRERSFDGREEQYQYNLAGELTAITNGNGDTIGREYDAGGQLMQVLLPDGTRCAYAYDALGNMISAIGPDGAVTFERDILGRVTREIQGEHMVERQFDAIGAILRTSTDLGYAIDYTPDPNGWPAAMSIDGMTVEIHRNARSQVAAQVLPGRWRIDQKYNDACRLAEQNVTGPRSSDVRLHRTFRYARDGSLMSVASDSTGTREFSYDPAEQLTAAFGRPGAAERFAYDPAGNLTSMAREDADVSPEQLQYSAGNRLSRKGNTLYEYDGQGRLTRKVEIQRDGTEREWTYTWDALDQLRTIQTPTGALWQYFYDALGRRIRKEGPDRQVAYVWDQNVIVHEIQDGQLASSWTFGTDDFAPVFKKSQGKLYAFVNDHLGTPQEMLDEDGLVVWSAEHSAWGLLSGEAGQAGAVPTRFPGQWYDDESTLFYNRFRYYDPGTGRYVSQDPMGLRGGRNFYAYAPNPVTWYDPFGLETCYVVRNPQGDVIYVGITSQPLDQREAQHNAIPGRANWSLEPVASVDAKGQPLSHDTVRGIEQGLIDHYGLQKDGGQLKNSINSMSCENAKLKSRMKKGDPYVDDFLKNEGEKRKRGTCPRR